MYLYVQMRTNSIEGLAEEFERFMRSLDPADAPNLLGTAPGSEPNPLIGQVLRFARGYNAIIARETRHLRDTTDQGRWVLDLTVSAVFSHLVAWGERYPLIEVVCDESKPLLAITNMFDVMVNRPDKPVLEAFGKRRSLTWNMAKPIAFASSAEHPGIQIADLVAGVTAAIPHADEVPELHDLAVRIVPHLNEECILPDMDHIDLARDEPPVNWFVLEELAGRADAGEDPLEGMANVYEIGKATLPSFREYQTTVATQHPTPPRRPPAR